MVLIKKKQTPNLMILINCYTETYLISKNCKNDQNVHIKAKLAIRLSLTRIVAILSLVSESSPVNTLSQNFDLNRLFFGLHLFFSCKMEQK